MGHRVQNGGAGEARAQLVGRDVLDPLVQPPQVPLRVADAGARSPNASSVGWVTTCAPAARACSTVVATSAT